MRDADPAADPAGPPVDSGGDSGADLGADPDKASLRSLLRHRRRARPPAQRAAAARLLADRVLGLPEVVEAAARGAVVTAYASYGSEPGTGPLLGGPRGAGARVLLPVVTGPALSWARYDGPDHLTVSARGIPEPSSGAAEHLGAAAIVLLPALAAGVDGRRLGQGGGFYDRALADLPRAAAGGPLRIALVHDDEVLPAGAVPAGPEDEPVDLVVTDRRVVRARPASA